MFLWGTKKAPLTKMSHTYLAMTKLDSYTLPEEDQKNILITWNSPWVLLTSAFLHWKLANFSISRNTDVDCIRYIISDSLVFKDMVTILIMPAKMATLCLVKIKVFQITHCDIIVFCPWHAQQNFITRLNLYCKCGHVTEVWQLYHFNERSYHNLNLMRHWSEKPFFWGAVLVHSQLFRTGTRYGLKVLRQCGKRVKTKILSVQGVNSCVCRSCMGKNGRGPFCPLPPIQNRQNKVKLKLQAQKYIYICATWKFKNVNLNSQWHNGF